MKIFYQIQDGAVISWQHGTEDPEDPQSTYSVFQAWKAAAAGRDVIAMDPEDNPPMAVPGHMKVSGGAVVMKTNQEIVAWEALPAQVAGRFSVNQFEADINTAFTGLDVVALMPFYGVFESMVAAKNFAGVKQRLADVLAAGAITSGQSDLFKQVLMNQNLNLADF